MMSAERVLLNAEPFGFGPAAAIAAIAQQLLDRGCRLGYIGQGHTLDLQRAVAYDDRYDLSSLTQATRRKMWHRAAKKYTTFVTAMDFQAAEEARQAGMHVIIYDALAWYWPELPEAVKKADMYLAQDFFGVRERLGADAQPYPKVQVVPSLAIPHLHDAKKRHVLLNMGGLQNPGWSLNDAVQYARSIVHAVRTALPDEEIVIATSRLVAEALADPDICTYDQAYMQTLLARSRMAIMTPGLGNIYDAASHNVPTLWLPPANDSQGRQLELLQEHGYCDAALTWKDLGLPIAMDAAQPLVLDAISAGVGRLRKEPVVGERLQTALSIGIQQIISLQGNKNRELLQRFGSGGAETVAAKIISFIMEHRYANVQ